jgi:hypothetical protein
LGFFKGPDEWTGEKDIKTQILGAGVAAPWWSTCLHV